MKVATNHIHWWFIVAITLLAILPRTILLNRIPTGMSNDEIDYIINAKSLFLSGKGWTGSASPIAITKNFPKAELPSVLLIPFVGPFPFSLFTSRLPFALLGVATVLLLCAITYQLFDSVKAISVGIMAAVNPWNIFFSRTAYDAPITTFFLLLALYIVLKTRGWMILWSIIPLFIAFHTYMGMMVLFIPFIAGVLLYAWITVSNKQSGWKYIIVFSICLLFVIRFFITLHYATTTTRASELLTPWSDTITSKVNKTRLLSIVNPFVHIYANKPVMFAREAVERYIGAFSPGLLLLHGDQKQIFTVYNYGLFHLTDIVGIVFGFYVIYKQRKNIFVLLVFIMCIAPLPSVFSNTNISYASRSYLLQPVLLIFLGVGVSELIKYCTTKKSKMIGVTVFVLLYSIQILQFSIVYFFRNPIENSDSYNFTTRIMARYAYFESQKSSNIYLLANTPETMYKHYLFYTNALTAKSSTDLSNKFAANDFKINNVHAKKCLPQDIDLADTTLIVDGDLACKTLLPEDALIVPLLSDGGSVYRIYNGKTCSGMKLGSYVKSVSMSDFDVEHLSEQHFCQTFITKY